MVDAKGRPHFLWDEDITLDVFRGRLADPDPEVRAYYRGKLMRGSTWVAPRSSSAASMVTLSSPA